MNACTGAVGDCSLRGAIANANGAGGSNTITFDAGVFNPGTITLTSALPNITGTLTLDGPGPSLLTVEGTSGFRLMYVSAGADLTVNGVTLANASTVDGGAALYVTGATLTVTNSVFSNNETTGNYGGALNILNGSTGSIGDTTFVGNGARGRGGAISVGTNSTLALTNCTLSGNHTDTVSTAGQGGAIFVEQTDATVSLTNCTLAGNTAINGGALYSYGTLRVTNSTIAGNTATGSSGGVYNRGVTLDLNNSIISGNTQGAGGSSQCDSNNSSNITNARSSLIEDNLGCVNGDNVDNLTGNAMLGALANNGGPTQTMALQAGSPAIDAGDKALAVDENGANGAAYVFSGATGLRIHRIAGTPGEGLGPGRGAGDVDGDGHADLIVGAYTYSGAGLSQGGRVGIFSGADLSFLTRMNGTRPGGQFGFDAVGVGDVTGDGRLDFIVASSPAGVVDLFAGVVDRVIFTDGFDP